MARSKGLVPNLNAFLDMIAVSELGRAILEGSDDGYNVLVGSTPQHIMTFDSYAQHPNVLEHLSAKLASTAAGRYQILHHYAVAYMEQLWLHDFGPESQDAIAIQMIRECGALVDVETSNVAPAIEKCASRWASLPGAGYGQHENRTQDLLAAYQQAGGTVAA